MTTIQDVHAEAWLGTILARREAYERAIGMPLGEILGCGHWGCVFASTPPWVVKITMDRYEGPMWLAIVDLFKGRPVGIPMVKEVVEMPPALPLPDPHGTGRRQTATPWAIVREEVAPLVELGAGGRRPPSARTQELAGDRVNVLEGRTRPSATARGQAIQRFVELQSQYYDRMTRISAREEDLRSHADADGWYGRKLRRDVADLFDVIDELRQTWPGRAVGELYAKFYEGGIFFRDNAIENFGWNQDNELVVLDPGFASGGAEGGARTALIENRRRRR